MLPPSRPATLDDAPAIGALERACEIAWWGEADTDDADVRHVLEWTGDLPRRTRLWPGADGGLAAFASAASDGQAQLLVDPALGPDERAALGAAACAWMIGIGARELDSPVGEAERLALLAAHGFAPVRSSFDLQLPADAVLAAPVWPEGVAAVPFDLERHPAALHELIYAVWTDVAGHHHRPIEEWQHVFMGHESFDPALVVVAERDGQALGVALCRTFVGGAFGWLAQLVVARSARGIGLGRAVLLEGLRRLAAVPGVTGLGLSVMAANTTALGLYRGVGLEITRETVVCERP